MSLLQSRVAYYWFKKTRRACQAQGRCHMGGFTRLLHSGEPDELLPEIPTVVVKPLQDRDHQGYALCYSGVSATICYVTWYQVPARGCSTPWKPDELPAEIPTVVVKPLQDRDHQGCVLKSASPSPAGLVYRAKAVIKPLQDAARGVPCVRICLSSLHALAWQMPTCTRLLHFGEPDELLAEIPHSWCQSPAGRDHQGCALSLYMHIQACTYLPGKCRPARG